LVNFDQVGDHSPLDRELRAADILQAIQRGFEYLDHQQRPDGSWIPLWFGNQDHAEELNPVYGTSRVLLAYGDLRRLDHAPARRAVDWLSAAQGPAGDWGSVEETSLALEALLADPRLASNISLQKVIIKGLQWLVEAIQQDRHRQPTPIGFYFARLWYYESLYPLVFATSALGQAVRRFAPLESFGPPDLQGQQLVSASNA
jgi:squalene-hopene/tetraprenyl-beta-curcumene cyclase